MQLVRWSASLFGTIAVLAALFAGATIWLLLTDPVTVDDIDDDQHNWGHRQDGDGIGVAARQSAGNGTVFGAQGPAEILVGACAHGRMGAWDEPASRPYVPMSLCP